MPRPLSSLKGRTPQANALAQWVRGVTQHVQVRDLAMMFSYSRSTWTALRNGTKNVSGKMVDELVDELVEPHLRETARQTGHRLRREAEQAEKKLEENLKADEPRPHPASRGDVESVLLRLDDARIQQLDAMHKLAEAKNRMTELETMVSFLQDKCVQLAAERDRAREEAHAEVEQLQQALEQSQALHEKAGLHLKHARRASDYAYELRVAAEEKVSEAKAAARQALRREPVTDTTGTDLPVTPEAARTVLPPVDLISEALDRAAAGLARQDQGLDELRDGLGLAAPEPSAGTPQVIVGTVLEPAVRTTPQSARETDRPWEAAGVVHATGTDNADNTLTGEDMLSRSDSLGSLLEKARTPKGIGAAMSVLRERAGSKEWTWERMVVAVDSSALLSDSEAAVRRMKTWFDGTKLPEPRFQWRRLLNALGATPAEIDEFVAAHMRASTFVHNRLRRLLVVMIWVTVLTYDLLAGVAMGAAFDAAKDATNGNVVLAIMLISLGVVIAALRGLGRATGGLRIRPIWLVPASFYAWLVGAVIVRWTVPGFGLAIAGAVGLV
ncbi:hypothetical protein [Streptomyces sp. NPDC057426]|uniref:hypothetical protein n=2 Tax=unclassified Streptomyces TaxID=2593676 RepID=UPI0036C451C6